MSTTSSFSTATSPGRPVTRSPNASSPPTAASSAPKSYCNTMFVVNCSRSACEPRLGVVSPEVSMVTPRSSAINTRAIDLTEALLLLSRADRRSFTREYVDLSVIAEEATETLLPLAEKRGVTIETSGDMTPTIGSQALLLQLSTNLVHNAIVHNLPEQGTV